MEKINIKLKELELKVEQLEKQQQALHESLEKQLDSMEITELINENLTDRSYITMEELDKKLSQHHLQIIKWMVATDLSTIAIIISLFGFVL